MRQMKTHRMFQKMCPVCVAAGAVASIFSVLHRLGFNYETFRPYLSQCDRRLQQPGCLSMAHIGENTWLLQIHLFFYKKLRIWASTKSYLNLSDFSYSDFLTSFLKGQGHVAVNKPVISIIYIVAHTWPLCSALT